MRRPRSVLLILFLLAGSLSPPSLGAQGQPGPLPIPEDYVRGFSIRDANPTFASPDTYIPFYLDESLFEQGPVVVTMRILNMLGQTKSIPEAVGHPAGRGTRLLDLAFREAGNKVAYWDGKDLSGQLVPAGVYFAQLVVSGRGALSKKFFVVSPRRGRGGIF